MITFVTYFARIVCWLSFGHRWARWARLGPLQPARPRFVCTRCGAEAR